MKKKDRIYTGIQNIGSNITKLEDKRTNKLKQIQDCIRNEHNNVGKINQQQNNNWYNLLACDMNDTQIITNGYDILKK